MIERKRRVPERDSKASQNKKKTTTNEKVLLGIGACCVGIILILALGTMLPDAPGTEPMEIEPVTETAPELATDTTNEKEYIDFMMSSANTMNRLLSDTVFDIDALLAGRISESQFISRESARKREYEGILSQLVVMTPPPAFKRSHDYYVKSIEYAILSSEYSIEGIRTQNPALIEEATRYMNLCADYTSKATDALPV